MWKWLPGRMKMFSTDSMAATGSMTSSQPRAADLSSARVSPGGSGNSTISFPRLVTLPFLYKSEESKTELGMFLMMRSNASS